MLDEIDFSSDSFEDIIGRDPRYNARAYALLVDCIGYLGKEGDGHMSGEAILDEFKERVLDQYGPLSYDVLTEWGLSSTEDIGEMMFNLAESNRVKRDESDTPESFAGGYDFKETFLGPYQA